MARARRQFGKGAQSRGKSGIVIQDDVTPFAVIAATNFKGAYARAIRHVGFEVQDACKRYVRANRKPLSELQSQRVVDKYTSKSKGVIRGLRRKKHAGDLNRAGKSIVNAIQYDPPKSNEKPVAIVGFASNDARNKSGKMYQEGRTSVVNRDMQLKFFAMASKARGREKYRLLRMASLAVGTRIRVPGRPIFDPVYRFMRSKIPRLIEKRVERNLGLLEDTTYQAILLDATGINENVRTAQRMARKQKRSRSA